MILVKLSLDLCTCSGLGLDEEAVRQDHWGPMNHSCISTRPWVIKNSCISSSLCSSWSLGQPALIAMIQLAECIVIHEEAAVQAVQRSD